MSRTDSKCGSSHKMKGSVSDMSRQDKEVNARFLNCITFTIVFKDSGKNLYLTNVLFSINIHEIVNDKQFGSRSNHSTYMAIIELVDKINNAVEKKNNERNISRLIKSVLYY